MFLEFMQIPYKNTPTLLHPTTHQPHPIYLVGSLLTYSTSLIK